MNFYVFSIYFNCKTKRTTIMNKKDLVEVNGRLISAITKEFNLEDNDLFLAIMHQISFHSVAILGMKAVALDVKVPDSSLCERNEYFLGVESIIKSIYPEFRGISPEEIMKLATNKSFSQRTWRERFEAMERLKNLIPKLRMSWIEHY